MKNSLKILFVAAIALNLTIAIFAITAAMGFAMSPIYLAFDATHPRILQSINLVVLISSFVLALIAMRRHRRLDTDI